MKISRETLHQLIENKLCQAGLKREHAATVAEVLVYADARGIHSHGAVRVEYYAERISKAAPTANRSFVLRNRAVLGNFTCRQCRRTGRGENGYGTCHQNRPAKWRCGGRYQPDGSQRRNLLFCAAGSPRRINWYFDVPVRSNGGAVWRRGNLLRY